jgi:hypothetical protein
VGLVVSLNQGLLLQQAFVISQSGSVFQHVLNFFVCEPLELGWNVMPPTACICPAWIKDGDTFA